jgi:hypothetical protein
MNLLTRFYIKNKRGKKVLFKLKPAQLDFLQNKTGRDIVLKPRQLGFTTLFQLGHLRTIMLNSNTSVATVAHLHKKLTAIFEIAKYAWENLPIEIRNIYDVKYDNVRELSFNGNNSKYFVDLDIRSGTVQHLHVSEFAYIKDIRELVSATFPAVPQTGDIVLETTANGLNSAYDFWQEAQEEHSEFTPHFYNWMWEPEYTMETPEDTKWKKDYEILAKKYNLIKDIQTKHKLSDEQFYWYYRTTLTQKETMKQDYPTVSEEAFLSSSISVFDLFKVSQLNTGNIIKQTKGVKIYHNPVEDHKYIIGIDTAEGVGSDNTAMHIWDITDNSNIIEVASFSDQSIRPDQIANIAIDLGNEYNEAFIIPERNGSGLTTVLKLKEKGYRNLFVNRQIDKKTQKQKNEYGWRTQGSNRDLMIDDFIELFENDNLVINSNILIQQMKTFVRKDNGRREHDTGYHDDSLFASFLAIQGIKFYRDHKYQSFNRNRLGI